MKPILLAMLASFVPVAAACPPTLTWEGIRSATTTYHDKEKGESGSVAITSYHDGTYARTGQKEIYFLRDHDLVVFRGLPAEEMKGPTPFFMIDMAVGIPIAFLAARFPTPCAVPEHEQLFEFTPPHDPLAESRRLVPVTGRASREGLSITYEVRTDRRPKSVLIHASGTLDFSPQTAVPQGLSLDGWQVAVRDKGGYRPLLPAEAVRTLGQLYEALPKVNATPKEE